MSAAVPVVKKDAKGSFNQAAAFFKQDKGFQPAIIISSILLGTTALATPLLGTMIGAGAALLISLGLLTKASDVVVDNASALGKKMKISSSALGVGLGVLTSLPELFVSGAALMAGTASVAIGNVTGSNIANILLILGVAAATRKIQSNSTSWKFNAAVMCGATALFTAQLAMGALSPVVGAVLLGGLGFYMWKSYRMAQQETADAEKKKAPAIQQPSALNAEEEQKKETVAAPATQKTEEESLEMKAPKWLNAGWGLAGVAGLVGSAVFVVSSAVALGTAAGISPAVIGVLAVAVGTSLPELAVSVKAARAGDSDMALGNVLGSNIFNILMIGGLLSLSGAAVPPDLNPSTSLGMLNTVAFGASALILSAVMMKTKGVISRAAGIAGLGLYLAFTVANFKLGGAPKEPEAKPAVTQPAITAAPTP